MVRLYSELIKRARLKAGLTQEEAASRLGVSRVAWTNWEGGRRDPGLQELPSIAAVLGVSPAELVIDREELARVVLDWIREGAPLSEPERIYPEAKDNVKVFWHQLWAA